MQDMSFSYDESSLNDDELQGMNQSMGSMFSFDIEGLDSICVQYNRFLDKLNSIFSKLGQNPVIDKLLHDMDKFSIDIQNLDKFVAGQIQVAGSMKTKYEEEQLERVDAEEKLHNRKVEISILQKEVEVLMKRVDPTYQVGAQNRDRITFSANDQSKSSQALIDQLKKLNDSQSNSSDPQNFNIQQRPPYHSPIPSPQLQSTTIGNQPINQDAAPLQKRIEILERECLLERNQVQCLKEEIAKVKSQNQYTNTTSDGQSDNITIDSTDDTRPRGIAIDNHFSPVSPHISFQAKEQEGINRTVSNPPLQQGVGNWQKTPEMFGQQNAFVFDSQIQNQSFLPKTKHPQTHNQQKPIQHYNSDNQIPNVSPEQTPQFTTAKVLEEYHSPVKNYIRSSTDNVESNKHVFSPSQNFKIDNQQFGGFNPQNQYQGIQGTNNPKPTPGLPLGHGVSQKNATLGNHHEHAHNHGQLEPLPNLKQMSSHENKLNEARKREIQMYEVMSEQRNKIEKLKIENEKEKATQSRELELLKAQNFEMELKMKDSLKSLEKMKRDALVTPLNLNTISPVRQIKMGENFQQRGYQEPLSGGLLNKDISLKQKRSASQKKHLTPSKEQKKAVRKFQLPFSSCINSNQLTL